MKPCLFVFTLLSFYGVGLSIIPRIFFKCILVACPVLYSRINWCLAFVEGIFDLKVNIDTRIESSITIATLHVHTFTLAVLVLS